MNPAKCNEYDYINFLIATQKTYSCTEAERVQPDQANPPAHDAVNRLLHRIEPTTEALWSEAQKYISLDSGVLVIDDSTLDKFYAKKIELVTRRSQQSFLEATSRKASERSGKHGRVVQGINLITLLWTEGDSHIPCDYRLYDKISDGATKNEYFRSMLTVAKSRGFRPACVVFDGWYSSLENLKTIRSSDWLWLTRLKRNRLVNPDEQGNRPLHQVEITSTGTVVHLKGYGLVKVFKIVTPDGYIDYWTTNDLTMPELKRLQLAEFAWTIEEYHRELKQFCGVERCQVRSSRCQRNHIGLAIRAFLRL